MNCISNAIINLITKEVGPKLRSVKVADVLIASGRNGLSLFEQSERIYFPATLCYQYMDELSKQETKLNHKLDRDGCFSLGLDLGLPSWFCGVRVVPQGSC